MLKAKEIMTREVITATPDTSVVDLAKLLLNNGINGVPVVDEDGVVVGIVTEADLVAQSKTLHVPSMFTFLDSVIFLENPKGLEEEIRKVTASTVGEVCTRQVISVDEETPVEKVATLMAEKGINTIPVLKDGKIVGIIGRRDILRAMVSGRKS